MHLSESDDPASMGYLRDIGAPADTGRGNMEHIELSKEPGRTIDRRQTLNPEEFVGHYLSEGRPVIVTDAMRDWPAFGKWTPDHLAERLGRHEVQVYNDLFDLVSICTLGQYLKKNFGRAAHEPAREYVRWYTRFRPVDFFWADQAFDALKEDWKTPYFLPRGDYVVPYGLAPATLPAELTPFPYKGLFISGRGARTRLHCDPWNSSAILCQLYGEKRVVMFAPDQAAYLMAGGKCVDLDAPDPVRFPHTHRAVATYETTLAPGECLFIPDGWLHDVKTLSDSISVTWNFVHRQRLAALCTYLDGTVGDAELEVLRYFLPAELQTLSPAALREALARLA
jgi:hypothetical protein